MMLTSQVYYRVIQALNGHYEAGNLRWATATEQRHNRRANTMSKLTLRDFGKPIPYQITHNGEVLDFDSSEAMVVEFFRLKAENDKTRQFICRKCGLREELGIKAEANF